MKLLASLILLSFIGLLTLGFTTMPVDGHHAQNDCVIATLSEALCSTTFGGMAEHHISAYTSFLGVMISFALLFALTLFAFVFLFEKIRLRLAPVHFEKTTTPQTHDLRHWLSLFINSPTFK